MNCFLIDSEGGRVGREGEQTVSGLGYSVGDMNLSSNISWELSGVSELSKKIW